MGARCNSAVLLLFKACTDAPHEGIQGTGDISRHAFMYSCILPAFHSCMIHACILGIVLPVSLECSCASMQKCVHAWMPECKTTRRKHCMRLRGQIQSFSLSFLQLASWHSALHALLHACITKTVCWYTYFEQLLMAEEENGQVDGG